MVRVPGFEGGGVAPDITPVVPVSTEVPLAAAGGGEEVARAFGAASEGFGAVKDLVDAEIKKAEDLRIIEDDLELSKIENSVLYDEKSGVLNMKGKNAFEAEGKMDESWRKGVSQIAKGRRSARQNDAFQRNMLRRRASMNSLVKRHVAGEIKRFDDEITTSYIEKNALSASKNYLDPQAVTDAILRNQRAIESYADRNGMSDQWVEINTLKESSRIHESVIEQMMNGGNFTEATGYFESVKGEILPDRVDTIGARVKTAFLKGQSAAIARSYFKDEFEVIDTTKETISESHFGPYVRSKPGAKTLGEAMAKVDEDPRLAKDEDLRSEVRKRVKLEWEDIKAVREEAYGNSFFKAQQILEETGNLDAIPMSLLTGLKSSDREALERRAGQIKKRKDPETDEKLFTELMLKPQDELAEFMPWHVWAYKEYLSEPDFRQFRDRVDSAKKSGSSPGNAAWKSIESEEEMILSGAKSAKVGGIEQTDTKDAITKDETKSLGYARFRKEIDRRLKSHFENSSTDPSKRKNASDEEKGRIIDQVAIDFSKRVQLNDYINEEKGIYDLTDEDYKEEMEISDADFSALMQIAKSTGLSPREMTLDVFKGSFYGQMRQVINRAYIAKLKGANESEISRILAGGQ
jgi:hypothetical protein